MSFPTTSRMKLELARSHGFKRISAGLQSADRREMLRSGRESAAIKSMRSVCELAWSTGIEKVNIDLMYGMPRQTKDSLKITLEAVGRIMPQQVTLYETRYNMVGRAPDYLGRDVLFEQYSLSGVKISDTDFSGNHAAICTSSRPRSSLANNSPISSAGLLQPTLE